MTAETAVEAKPGELHRGDIARLPTGEKMVLDEIEYIGHGLYQVSFRQAVFQDDEVVAILQEKKSYVASSYWVIGHVEPLQ